MQETFYTVPGCPVLVAQVSDLHERPYDDVITSLQRNRPDLICVTGDFFFGVMPRTQTKAEESGMLSFFAACAELAPCFVSLGNHEWLITPEDITLIARTGVHILDNACTVCTVKGAQLVIGGLSSGAASAGLRLAGEGIDLRTPYLYEQLKKVPPVTDWLDAFCSTPGYRVLLCHHPEYYPRYCKDRDIPLILSGHAHGGQIRIFGQGLFSPGQGFFPKHTSGTEDGRLVISRGLANRQKVPRLFNPPEIVYVCG